MNGVNGLTGGAGALRQSATALAVAGSAGVFLLACAALLNAALRGAPIPAALHDGAVVAHVLAVCLALPLGIAQLVLPKGTFRHRTVGYVWCALMVATALLSFAIHEINPGGLSAIHLFSVVTLLSVPLIIVNARAGRVAQHQRGVLILVVSALVVAGSFTFLPNRALGRLVLALWSGW